MSLEKDVTEMITRIREAGGPVFKPASADNLNKRKEDHLKKIAEYNIIPVDQEALDLDTKYWNAVSALENRLNVLQANNNVDMCNCDHEKIEAAGEDWESTEIPGDNGYLDGRCLRCGGDIDLT